MTAAKNDDHLYQETPIQQMGTESPERKNNKWSRLNLTDKREDIRELQVINGLRFDTNHRMITLHLKMKRRMRPFIIFQSSKADRNYQQQYREMLQHTLTDPNQQSEKNTQILYTKLSKCILQDAKRSTFLNKKSEKQDKMKDTTKRLIENKEELKTNANANDA
jgi:hypothetical protein